MNALVLALLLFAVEVSASDPVRRSAALPSQAGSWAPPTHDAVSGTPLGGSASTVPGWPEVRGPFSWADRILNSTTIARSGGVYALRAKIRDIYTPTVDACRYFRPFLSATPTSGVGISLNFFSYALGSRLYEDAAALLFTPGVFQPSDTLHYLRGVTAYDIHDFPLAASCFASVPDSSTFFFKAQSFLDVWNSTPEPSGRKKSALFAGVMSAVLPGSGKIYAGDLRSGLSTLLVVGALGGMTAESWIKLGGRDWLTIALSSVFGLFYIGNIYGSALSVSVIQNAYQDAEKATLLFSLRIPLHHF